MPVMKGKSVLALLVGGGVLVALFFLAFSHPRPAAVHATRHVPAQRVPPMRVLQPVPPMGDAMPVLRPRPGLDTGMPVIQFDSMGRRRERTKGSADRER